MLRLGSAAVIQLLRSRSPRAVTAGEPFGADSYVWLGHVPLGMEFYRGAELRFEPAAGRGFDL